MHQIYNKAVNVSSEVALAQSSEIKPGNVECFMTIIGIKMDSAQVTLKLYKYDDHKMLISFGDCHKQKSLQNLFMTAV